MLDKIFLSEEEVIDMAERAILFFRDEGLSGERFADTIDRLGFAYVQDKLLNPRHRSGSPYTANYVAKKSGVKTGMALWQAKQVCPEIIFVPPRMDLYLRFSRMAQEIYSEYTDLREPFGIDESWLDVSASTSIKGDGMKIALAHSRHVV